jgi:hypothetical protein
VPSPVSTQKTSAAHRPPKHHEPSAPHPSRPPSVVPSPSLSNGSTSSQMITCIHIYSTRSTITTHQNTKKSPKKISFFFSPSALPQGHGCYPHRHTHMHTCSPHRHACMHACSSHRHTSDARLFTTQLRTYAQLSETQSRTYARLCFEQARIPCTPVFPN